MISPEQLRRYTFFSGLTNDQIITLAKQGNEKPLKSGEYFFHEGDVVKNFYLVLEGTVAIVLEVPDQDAKQGVADTLTRKVTTKDITVSTIGVGSVFGWPGLIPPHTSNASAKAVSDCKVVAFDCASLLENFKEDPAFGYAVTLSTAQVMRERLRDLQIESLASST